MKVLVCGSRDWDRPTVIKHRLFQLPAGSVVLHGAARGADETAALYAKAMGLGVRDFPADWNTHGKRAGILRNLQMLDEKPDLVLAFRLNGSRGTSHTISEAKRRGIPVEVVDA